MRSTIPPAPTRIISAPPPAALPNRRILIIDDHSFFSACLRALIEREIPRAVCEWAASGGGVFDRIDEFRPDLLVVDLSIGAMNGYVLAEALRAQGVSTPILFASSGPSLPRRALQRVRSAAFISKAASPRSVVARIRQQLGLEATVSAAVPSAMRLNPNLFSPVQSFTHCHEHPRPHASCQRS